MNRPAPATRPNRWPSPTRAGGRDVRHPVGPAWWRRVEIDRTLGGGGFAQPRPQPGPDLLRRVGPALPLAGGDPDPVAGAAERSRHRTEFGRSRRVATTPARPGA